MTQEGRYSIIFTGKLVQGIAPATVLENLARLFKSDAAKIRSIFSAPGAVIRKDLDAETARRYVAALKSAGAVCGIQGTQPPAAPAQKAAPPQSGRVRIISYQLGATELAYSRSS